MSGRRGSAATGIRHLLEVLADANCFCRSQYLGLWSMTAPVMVLMGLLIWLLCAPSIQLSTPMGLGQLLQDKWERERSRVLKPQLKARNDRRNEPTYLGDSRYMT